MQVETGRPGQAGFSWLACQLQQHTSFSYFFTSCCQFNFILHLHHNRIMIARCSPNNLVAFDLFWDELNGVLCSTRQWLQLIFPPVKFSPPRHNSGRFSSDTGTLTMDPSRVIFHLLSQIFLLFTPYYRNLATFDLLSCRCSQFPRRSKKQAVALLLTHTHTPLKRIIYTGQVWDQSNLCGTIEYTNLRSDVSLAEGEASWERDRE